MLVQRKAGGRASPREVQIVFGMYSRSGHLGEAKLAVDKRPEFRRVRRDVKGFRRFDDLLNVFRLSPSVFIPAK